MVQSKYRKGVSVTNIVTVLVELVFPKALVPGRKFGLEPSKKLHSPRPPSLGKAAPVMSVPMRTEDRSAAGPADQARAPLAPFSCTCLVFLLPPGGYVPRTVVSWNTCMAHCGQQSTAKLGKLVGMCTSARSNYTQNFGSPCPLATVT